MKTRNQTAFAVMLAVVLAGSAAAQLARVALYRTVTPPEPTIQSGYFWIGTNGAYGNPGTYGNPFLYAYADTNAWQSGVVLYFQNGTHTNLTGTTNLVVSGSAMDGTTNNVFSIVIN